MLKNSVVTIFSTVLLLSLMCSMSLQESLAQMAIAESADLIKPVKSDEKAPSFVEPNYKVRLPSDELLVVAKELAENGK